MAPKRTPKRSESRNQPGAGPGSARLRRSAETAPISASLDVVDFAVARATELSALRQASKAINGNRRVYQQLSWHARRRTMSHSSYRMPARLRVAHAKQLKQQRAAGAPEKPPGPRGAARMRKYRRKARFLQAIRKLRAKNPVWLETHVWHAKRFRMGILGGRRVAQACNDRGIRSCYRAAAHASVIHDASYLEVVELCAQSKGTLKDVLRRRLSFEDGRRASVDPVVNGTRRVKDLVLLDRNGAAVAVVDILWRPGSVAQLWMWVLPVMKEHVKTLFSTRFSEERDGLCKVSALSTPPLCFSVLGPRSGTVLGAVLQSSIDSPQDLQFITRVRSPACLPASCVFAGSTEDPRGSFPPKTMAMHHKNVTTFGKEICQAFRTVAESELWEEGKRQLWKQLVVSGKKASSDIPQGKVPFILLQANDGTQNGFASGWDLIIPSGWGMAFWMSLMYSNGNRAIGQEEMRFLKLEAGLPIFPEDFMDTITGSAALRAEEKGMKEAYSRRPKSKRVNYTLNRIESPMFPALHTISRLEALRAKRDSTDTPPRKKRRPSAADTGVEDDDVVDEREIRIIRSTQKLQQYLEDTYGILLPDASRLSLRRGSHPAAKTSPVSAARPVYTDGALVASHSMFVRVTVVVPGKGVPTKNGLICAAAKSDLSAMHNISKGSRYGGLREPLAKNGEGKPTRELIGFVTVGTFSLVRGAGIANGIVSVAAIKRLTEQNAIIDDHKGRKRGGPAVAALFRNVNSLQYRPAYLYLRR